MKLSDYRVLFTLAWPVVIARSTQAIVGFSDSLMIAPLGEASLAAVTTGSINVFTVTIFPMGVAFILQSFAAQLTGRKRADIAIRYAWYGILLSMGVMVLSLASIPFIHPLLGLLSFETEVHHLMSSYIELRVWSVGAIVATEALGNWYGGIGNTRYHMAAGIVAMICNIFLNWLLIYGHGGFPAMGVRGAALASVIAAWIGFSVLLFAFLSGASLGHRGIRPQHLNFFEFGRVLRFGIPQGLNWLLEFTAFAVFINVVVAGLGTTVLAAMMVVFNINSVSFMPAFGLASAGAILVGQEIGGRRPQKVGEHVRRTLICTVSWQVTVGSFYFLIPETIMLPFSPTGEVATDLQKIGSIMLAISAAWQLFDGISMTLSETLRAAGDTLWTLWARLIIVWFFFLPAALIGVRILSGGYVAAMFCIVGDLMLVALVFAWRFRRGAWRKIDLTGDGEPELHASPR